MRDCFLAGLTVVGVFGIGLGCGATSPTPEPVSGTDPSASPTLEAFAGAYTIEGQPSADGCAGQVVLAAQHILIDPNAGSLHADVVDRVYPARVDGAELIAEGRFDEASGCPSSTIYERWTLRRTADGALSGTLASTWALPSDCMHPCTVRFTLVARP